MASSSWCRFAVVAGLLAMVEAGAAASFAHGNPQLRGGDCNGNGVPDSLEEAGPLDGFAVKFDGVDDAAAVPGFGAIAPTTEITIEFWQKADSVKDQTTLLLRPDNPSNRLSVSVPWGDGNVYWAFGDSSAGGQLGYLPPEPIAGEWNHFAFTASQAGNFMRVYRNGILEATKVGMAPRAPDATVLRIGGLASAPFGGIVDEVRIWTVARDQAAIQSTMNTTLAGDEPGLLAYWRLDEGTGTTAGDSAGTSDATLVMGAAWQAVYVDANDNGIPDTCEDCNGNGVPDSLEEAGPLDGFAVKFDGVDDAAAVPGFGAIAPTTEITIELWQKVDSVKAQMTLALMPDVPANRFAVSVPWSDGNVYWDFGDIGGAGRLGYLPPEPIVGEWNHFAFTASQAGNSMRIYRNGILEAAKAGMDPRAVAGTFLRIGGLATAPFGGIVDEVRIWTIARSQAAIQATMNTTLAGDEPGLLAYWRLDEGTGTTAGDSAGSSEATLVMGAAWQAVHVDEDQNGIPDECEATAVELPSVDFRSALLRSAPNPISAGAAIEYVVPSESRITLAVYDVTGRLVRTLVEGFEPAGVRTISWDARDDAGRPLAAGVYFYRLRSGEGSITQKAVIVR
jgi:hypothetical protein